MNTINAEEYLDQKSIPNRTISGRKPTGQIPEYRSSLSELLEEYHQSKLENNGVSASVSGRFITDDELRRRELFYFERGRNGKSYD